MKTEREGRLALAGRVFRPLAAGVLALCALLSALIFAAAYPSAREESCVGSLLLAAAGGFVLAGGGSVCLIRAVCRRYLDPVTQAAAIVAQAAEGDHSAPLSNIPRNSEETAVLLNAAGELGTHSADCLLELEGVLRRIGDGDLTAQLPCGRGAECGGACGALDGMSQRLRGGIGAVRSALDQLAGQLDELEQDVQRLSQSGQDRRQDREAMSRALERLNKRLQSRAEGAQAVRSDAENLCLRLTEYEKKVGELTQSAERISDCAAGAEKIVKAMESTAFQCSVLARTAYVEAAGAGVNGKGFAIVASEMRVLASRSAQAAQDAAALMEEMDRTVQEGAGLVAEVSQELEQISDEGRSLYRCAAGTAEEARDTREGQDAIYQAVRLSSAAEEDWLLASHIAVSAAILRERAARLREALRVFRLN